MVIKKRDEAVEEFERKVKRLEGKYREVKQENRQIKDYIYALSSVLLLVIVLFFVAKEFTGHSITDFSSGTLSEATSESTFSHVSLSSSDPPYSYTNVYGSTGIIAYFPFDGDHIGQQTGYGTSGGTAVNYVDGQPDGTYTGGAYVNTVACKSGRCAVFDGNGDYIDVGNTLPDVSYFTYTAWVKPNFDNSYTAGSNPIIHWGSGQNPRLYMRFENGDLMYIDDGSSGPSEVKIYWDGSLLASATNADLPAYSSGEWHHVAITGKTNDNLGGQPLYIGSGSATHSGRYFDGSMDEVMIFDHALTAEQISAIYSETSPRFASTQGNHSFTVDLGTNSTANFTLGDYVTPSGTSIQLQVSSASAHGAITDFTSGTITNYALPSGDLSSATVTLIYNSDGNRFFSPVAGPNITIDAWGSSFAGTVNVSLSTTGISGEHYSFANLDNSLVGWWRGEGNTNDESGNGNTGTLQGNANASSPGKYNSSFGFDGTGDYVSLACPSNVVNKFSVFAWIKTTAAGLNVYNSILAIGDPSNSKRLYFETNGTGNLRASFHGSDWVGSGVVVNDNSWHHVGTIYDGTNLKTYVDGVQTDSEDRSSNELSCGTFDIGRDSNSNTYFNGLIDDVLLFNRSLSASEVLSLYNAQTSQYQSNISVSSGVHTVKGYAVDLSATNYSTLTTSASVGETVSFTLPYQSLRIQFSGSTPTSTTTGTTIPVQMTTSDSSGRHYSFVDFDNSLVGWWRGENNANDENGNYNGEWVGSSSYASGKFGNAMSFSDNSLINASINSTFNMRSPNTWSFWMKSSDTGDRPVLITKTNELQPSAGWYIKTDGTTFKFGGYDNAEKGVSFVPDGNWHHMVLVSNGSDLKFYIDNSLAGTSTYSSISTPANNVAPLRFGNNPSFPGGSWTGLLDDVMFFNRSLSSGEIASLYNSQSNQYQNNFTSLALGSHSFTGYAVDLTGNLNSTTRSVTIEADNTAPSIEFTSTTTSATTTNTTISVGLNTIDASGEHYSFVDFDNSLVGWWRGENNPNDDSGKGNTGTLVGGVTYASGKFNQSFNFNGSQYVQLSSLATTSPATFQGAFSISTWIKSTTGGVIFNVDTGVNGCGAGDEIQLLMGSGVVKMDNVCVSGAVAGDIPVGDGTWHHVVVVHPASGNTQLYVDNVLDISANLGGNLPNSAKVSIGARWEDSGASSYYTGQVDDLLVFNRTLTTIEIASLYNSQSNQYSNNFTSLATGTHSLTGYAVDLKGNLNSTTRSVEIGNWPVNVTLSTTAISGDKYSFVDFDNSLVGWWRGENNPNDENGVHNGTLQGGTTYVSGKYNRSFSFDGTGDYVSISDAESLRPTNQITISAWFNQVACSNDWAELVSNSWGAGWSAPYTSYYLQACDGAGTLIPALGVTLDGVANDLKTSSAVYSNGRWVHLVGVYNGSAQILYVNGTQVASRGASGTISYNLNDSIIIGGRSATSPGQEFNGIIDEVLIFNRSLSASEILALYNSTANQYSNSFTANNGTSYSIKSYAVDSSGVKYTNTTTAIAPANVSLTLGGSNIIAPPSDTTKPTITVTSPGNTTYLLSSVTINFTSSDETAVSARWFYNGTGNTSYNGVTSQLLTDGQYTFIFYSNDTSNNLNSTSVTFVVDTANTGLASCLNQCTENAACNVSSACHLDSSMCSNGLCQFTNLTISAQIKTGFDGSGNGKNLAINITTNATSPVLFLSGGSINFSGRPGATGGNASIVNITVVNLFNTTSAFFYGTGGASTGAGANGGNGGRLQINARGWIRQFSDNDISFGVLPNNNPVTTGALNGGSSASGSSGSRLQASVASIFNKDLSCSASRFRDQDVDGNGLVNLDDDNSISLVYNYKNGEEGYFQERDINCDGNQNIIEMSRIGLAFETR